MRNKSTRNAIFLTVLFIFGGMLYRVAQGDLLVRRFFFFSDISDIECALPWNLV